MTRLGELHLELPGGRPVLALYADWDRFHWEIDDIKGEDCPGCGPIQDTLNQLAAIHHTSMPGPPGADLLREAAQMTGGTFHLAYQETDDAPDLIVG